MKRHMPVLISLALFVFFLTPAAGQEHLLRILHMNDFHGSAEPHKPAGSDKSLGGIAFLAGEVGRLRSERPSIFLAAGDMIRGNDWADSSLGQSVIETMNAMEFDAMVLGNHEFDFGQAELRKRIQEAKFPLLGANVEGLDGLRPYVIKEAGGTRVAIIGVVTEDTPRSTHPRNVAGLRFGPPVEAVERYVCELKGKADIIIVLSHIGYALDRELAEQVKGIDVIVGGHSHTKLARPVKVDDTIIVQAWEQAQALGVLDLTIRDGKIVNFTGGLDEIIPVLGREDKNVMEIIGKYRDRLDKADEEVIGTATVDFDAENVRTRETTLGDLIADIMRQVSGADAAITNGGGIRSGVSKGIIRAKDVYSMLPFDTYIIAIRLTGRQIREVLEHGVSAVERAEGRFPQVSGLRFTYSASAPPGARVKEVLIGGEPLEPDSEYVVAANDFMAAGGDGFKTFGDAIKGSGGCMSVEGVTNGQKVAYSDPGRWLRDVVTAFIKERREISAVADGRIKEVH
jgi:5'-nucleotidase/UDP-sugar diphosphatase